MMTILRSAPTIRQATLADYSQLTHLINFEARVHKHLDWKTPLDWLPSQPYYVAELNKVLLGALACPPDPPEVAWLRLFCVAGSLSAADIFQQLLDPARQTLAGSAKISAIALHEWFSKILETHGFIVRQHIVVLDWHEHIPKIPLLSKEIMIRPMELEDIPGIESIDAAAFEPLWHNSAAGLRQAYRQSAWATVAEDGQGVIGYQISTAVPLSGHLARLAVHPDRQHAGIGAALVVDLLRRFQKDGAWHVTVNTQDDNDSSLALYEKLGFRRTGEVFPVFTDQG